MRGTSLEAIENARDGVREDGPEKVEWELVASAQRPGDELRGESEAMRKLRSQIRLLGRLPSTVLLAGETGVGKGLVARALHRAAGDGRGPFVHVDCASLSPSLIESELFGHERGAFTGALARRAGCFERAGAGTLFLDEIGELEGRLQSKLLRVLQDREFERIGGVATLHARARVIAATSRELRQEMREGRFRSDLYFRLNVLRLEIPSLRSRREDVPELAREGARQLCARLGRRLPVFSDSLCEALSRRAWPGNVRELWNVVERLLILRPGAVLDVDALEGLLDEAEAHRDPSPLRRIERVDDGPDRIEAALHETRGNVARAARSLGLPRSTLRRRIRSYGLSTSPFRLSPGPPAPPSGSGGARSG